MARQLSLMDHRHNMRHQRSGPSCKNILVCQTSLSEERPIIGAGVIESRSVRRSAKQMLLRQDEISFHVLLFVVISRRRCIVSHVTCMSGARHQNV